LLLNNASKIDINETVKNNSDRSPEIKPELLNSTTEAKSITTPSSSSSSSEQSILFLPSNPVNFTLESNETVIEKPTPESNINTTKDDTKNKLPKKNQPPKNANPPNTDHTKSKNMNTKNSKSEAKVPAKTNSAANLTESGNIPAKNIIFDNSTLNAKNNGTNAVPENGTVVTTIITQVTTYNSPSALNTNSSSINGSAEGKNIPAVKSVFRCQFHQRFMSSFYVCRSKKCKMAVKSSFILHFLDLRTLKLLVNMLVKSTSEHSRFPNQAI